MLLWFSLLRPAEQPERLFPKARSPGACLVGVLMREEDSPSTAT